MNRSASRNFSTSCACMRSPPPPTSHPTGSKRMTPLEPQLLARLDAERDRSVAFLQDLLRVPSPNPPGDTRAAADFLKGALRNAGLETKTFSPHPEMPNI